MKFSDLHLEPSLSASIEKLGYLETTPIQTAVFPHVLEGKDLSGLAQTGTGKTAAFVIPLMDRILKSRVHLESLSEDQRSFVQKRSFQDWKAQNFILILVPTRELAEQVHENILKLGEASGLRGISVYGGTGYDKQKEGFKNQVEFVVATPGRLIDLYKEHVVDLKQVRAIVFDEADRMFDMGFKDDMKFILSRVPRERQFLVFSATLNFDVLNTAYQFGAEPVEIDVSRDQAKAENVKDEIFHVGQNDKPMYLLSLLKKHNPKQAIIFSNFKHNVERIARFLSENGVPAMGISSLLTQAQRTRVMEQFKAENEKNILVATDVAARGLDIKGVDLVINFELPQDAESYVHRIGRTGRAGSEGHAFSLVSDRDVESLSRIEDYLKHKIEIGWMEDSHFVKDIKAFPSEESRGRSFGDSRESHRGGSRNERGGGHPRREAGPRRHSREKLGPQRRDNRKPHKEAHGNSGNRTAHQHPKMNGHQSPHKKHSQSSDRPHSHHRKPQAHRTHRGEHKPHPHKSAQAKPPAPNLMKKVSSFFKKLLGD